MPRDRDDPPAIRVYTVCDESRYLIVRNVPALGCGEELFTLFGSYGEVEVCKPMDAEDCEPFTDVYWINFSQVSNARFAKRKLDESVFLGNKLQVFYAPQFESLADTKDKLEGRRRDVLGRIKSGRPEGSKSQFHSHQQHADAPQQHWSALASPALHGNQRAGIEDPLFNHVSSNKDYFPSHSMNQTVHAVREKLDQIQSSSSDIEAGPTSKKARIDNRRRI